MWMQECATCVPAQVSGIQAWMKHLTEVHPLPTEWPSDRASRLTGQAAMKPYTTITESKKRRRKDSIPRPLNSFMLFAQHIRRNVLRVFSEASNSLISQQLGSVWRTVPRSCKNRYDEEASRLVKIHQMEFPNYKYQPKKRTQQTPSSSSASSLSSSQSDGSSSGNRITLSQSPSWPNSPDNSSGRTSWYLNHHHQQHQLLQNRIGGGARTNQNGGSAFDSAYSSRKDSCDSSSGSSPPVTEFSTPIKLTGGLLMEPLSSVSSSTQRLTAILPSKRIFHDSGRQHIRQRFASATNGTSSRTTAAAPRPASCSLSPPDLHWDIPPTGQKQLKRVLQTANGDIATTTTPLLFCSTSNNSTTHGYILTTTVTTPASTILYQVPKLRPVSFSETGRFEGRTECTGPCLAEINGTNGPKVLSSPSPSLSPSTCVFGRVSGDEEDDEDARLNDFDQLGSDDYIIRSEDFVDLGDPQDSAETTGNLYSEGGIEDEDSDNGFFDGSLDAMMQTIDITTFLPGAFSRSDAAELLPPQQQQQLPHPLGAKAAPVYNKQLSMDLNDILSQVGDQDLLAPDFIESLNMPGALSPDLECLDTESLLKI
uniref:HMG box domain-containing protein n=1 Tax=Schistocephalus solidus TaxID=70667 RepID=A0A0V0J9M7_SCHSO